MVNRKTKRRGLTLAELLVAATIMLLIAAAMGTLASTVKSTNEYCQGYTLSAQHARVALSRIERTVMGAYGNEQFPGCLIVAEQAKPLGINLTFREYLKVGLPLTLIVTALAVGYFLLLG